MWRFRGKTWDFVFFIKKGFFRIRIQVCSSASFKSTFLDFTLSEMLNITSALNDIELGDNSKLEKVA
jgi:hypothetical protein